MSKCKCSVKVKNLSVTVFNRTILDNISFEVNHGEMLALIGRNGSGKTTLLDSILNYKKYRNSFSFFNSLHNIVKNPKIGYVPQNLNFDRDSPINVFDLFKANLKKEFFWKREKKLDVKKICENLLKKVDAENCMYRRIAELSGGELQRILLAFALEPLPDILLLDEPVSAVDQRGIEIFYKLLASLRNEYHMPTIIVLHDLVCVQKYATNYALVDKRIIEFDNVKNFHKSEAVKKVFGSNLF